MTTIYEIGPDRLWTGETQEIPSEVGISEGWTRSAPPPLGPGQYAYWVGGGIWDVMSYAPIPEAPPAIPTLIASGVFTVGGVWPDSYIDTMGAVSGFSAVFPIDVGQYWLFFNTTQPDLGYAAHANASAGHVNITDRTVDYIELCIKDGSAPIDPSEFSVNIVRSI